MVKSAKLTGIIKIEAVNKKYETRQKQIIRVTYLDFSSGRSQGNTGKRISQHSFLKRHSTLS